MRFKSVVRISLPRGINVLLRVVGRFMYYSVLTENVLNDLVFLVAVFRRTVSEL